MSIFRVLLLVILLSSCYESSRNCKDFKTGSFSSEIIINGKIYTSTFQRDQNLQIERYNKRIDSSKVRWINDCEVIFTTINPKSKVDKKDVHLKILTTTENSYTYEYSYVGENNKQKGTATKID